MADRSVSSEASIGLILSLLFIFFCCFALILQLDFQANPLQPLTNPSLRLLKMVRFLMFSNSMFLEDHHKTVKNKKTAIKRFDTCDKKSLEHWVTCNDTNNLIRHSHFANILKRPRPFLSRYCFYFGCRIERTENINFCRKCDSSALFSSFFIFIAICFFSNLMPKNTIKICPAWFSSEDLYPSKLSLIPPTAQHAEVSHVFQFYVFFWRS